MEGFMKKVGIVPEADLFFTDNVYDDKYHIANTYVTRAVEAGLLPVGILAVDGRVVKEQLEECDCFLLVGGNHLWTGQLQVIDHAVKTGKKVLGICLGCQAIHAYFRLLEDMKKQEAVCDIGEFWERLDESAVDYFMNVKDHCKNAVLRGQEDDVRHKVFIEEGSLLHEITGKTEIMAVSLHTYACKDPAPGVVISAVAADGVAEAVEYGKNIIGTQFHPDLDRDLSCIFEYLARV